MPRPTPPPKEYQDAVFDNLVPSPVALVDAGVMLADFEADKARYGSRCAARTTIDVALPRLTKQIKEADAAQRPELRHQMGMQRVNAMGLLERTGDVGLRACLEKFRRDLKIVEERCAGRKEILGSEKLVADQREVCEKLAVCDGQNAKNAYETALTRLNQLIALNQRRPAEVIAEERDQDRLADLRQKLDEAEASLLDPRRMKWETTPYDFSNAFFV